MKYTNNPTHYTIQFEPESTYGLCITLNTKNLIIRSVQPSDLQEFVQLLGDSNVMAKVGTGKPLNPETVDTLFSDWLNDWAGKNPYSVYAIWESKTQAFVGLVALKPHLSIEVSNTSQSELGYAFNTSCWGKGYGREVMNAVFQSLIPRLILRDYKFANRSVRSIVATAHPENIASQKMLTAAGFKAGKTISKYGSTRICFNLEVKPVVYAHQSFFTRCERERRRQEYNLLEDGVTITAEEMANSSFGRQSNTAKQYERSYKI